MNEPTVDAATLERLRAQCLALPEATEQAAWGDPTWRVRKKIFAMQKGNYAGGRPSVWLKAEPLGRQSLLASDPETYFVPPYVGHKGWVGVYLDGEVPWPMLEELIRQSYVLIAPKRLAAQI